ncbi:sodium channel protein Nach [Onthophagus taurus]|uniref:sodium channel protein Nach n=1 Tax=Onthophagus taurus TaxID=166361 RepID=UPI0039BEA405
MDTVLAGTVKRNKKKTKSVCKTMKLLETSWTVQAKLFFQNCTLHGVKYLTEKGRPLSERIIWFLCVAIAAVTATIIIVSLWEKFQTNPTITGLDTDFHDWEVAFPAITVCPSAPIDIEAITNYIKTYETAKVSLYFFSKTKKTVSVTKYELKMFDDEFYTGDIFISDSMDLRDFAMQFVKSCENVFTECIWKSESYVCCDGFFPIFTEIGFCYTFNSRHYEMNVQRNGSKIINFDKKYIKETDIKWSLKFNLEPPTNSSSIPIFIHNSDEVPGLEIKRQHLWTGKVDKISFSVKQTYTTEDARQLTTKQRHCVFEDEQKLLIDHIYTFSACTRECRMRNSMKFCNCVPHFYPRIDNHFKHCTLKQLKCVEENSDDIQNVDKCLCLLGCSNTVYEVEKFNENLESTSLETEFVSWPMVRYKREVLFGWVDLLVSFGGIAGLFLGFSLLSAVEIVYYFVIRAWCMLRMEKEELKRVQRDANLKRKRGGHDMSLVPKCFDKNRTVYRRNINFVSSNRITPMEQQKNRELIVSPFGIEYLN